MKKIFLLIAITILAAAKAQVIKISLQAGGLTCSMCSNSIYKALKTLDFVKETDADIKTYTFDISFKKGKNVDFDRIREKVEEAGFSVSSFIVEMHFNKFGVKSDQPVTIFDKTFLFVNNQEQLLDGIKKIKILDKGFVSSKEFKKNSFPVSSPGKYHAIIN
jgi:copper chaperone CopZ